MAEVDRIKDQAQLGLAVAMGHGPSSEPRPIKFDEMVKKDPLPKGEIAGVSHDRENKRKPVRGLRHRLLSVGTSHISTQRQSHSGTFLKTKSSMECITCTSKFSKSPYRYDEKKTSDLSEG